MRNDVTLVLDERPAGRAQRRHWWWAWLGAALAWLVLSIVFAPEVYLYFQARSEPISWARAFLLTLSNAAIAAAFAPLIVWLARRFPFEKGRWKLALVVHLPACLVFAEAHTAVYFLVCYASKPLAQTLLQRFHPNLLTYWAIVAATAAFDYFGRYRAREQQLARLQTQLLKAQLRPHFLFNTLNTISAMIHEDVQAADRMLGHLSEVLRLTVESLGRHEVPLRSEIDLVDRYLEIDRIRFDGGIGLATELETGTQEALVPSMVLQPLVENAVRHGFEDRSSGGTITIRAVQNDEQLCLEVEDDGRGLDGSREKRPEEGIGLSATRRRLEQMYPGIGALTIETGLYGGAMVKLCLPLRFERGVV